MALILSFALFFYIWFLGSLRSALAKAEGGTGRLSAVAFGGGLLGAAFVMLIITVNATAAFRPEETSPELTRMLNDLTFVAGAPVMGAFTALFAATAAVTLRTNALPAWLGWLTAVAALAQPLAVGAIFEDSGAFSGDGVLGFLVPFATFVVAILAISIVLVRQAGAGAGAAQSAAPPGPNPGAGRAQ